MKFALIVVFLSCIYSCKQNTQGPISLDEVEIKVPIENKEIYTPTLVDEWVGATIIPVEKFQSFCKTFASFKNNIKSISNGSCKDLEITENTFMVGNLFYSINNKDFQMFIYGFLPNDATINELPKTGNTTILGNLFNPVEMENKEVKAYLSEDMIRIYINPEVKLTIANTCLTEPVDYREGNTKSQVELIEVGNRLLEKLIE